jgi:uncharacterized membrane protein
MEYFLRIVGKLYLIMGTLAVLFSILVFSYTDAWTALLYVLSSPSNIRDYPAGTLYLAFMASHALLVAIPTIIAGVGILRYQEWSRDLAVVSAVLQLAGFPLGTALGGFALWALFLNASGSYFHQERPPGS